MYKLAAARNIAGPNLHDQIYPQDEKRQGNVRAHVCEGKKKKK